MCVPHHRLEPLKLTVQRRFNHLVRSTGAYPVGTQDALTRVLKTNQQDNIFGVVGLRL